MRWFFRFSALMLAAAILVLSLEPATSVSTVVYSDKVRHFIAYGLLALLMALGWPKLRPVFVILIAASFGVAVEIAQGLTDLGRTASVLDGLANLVGAAFGALAARIASNYSRHRSS